MSCNVKGLASQIGKTISEERGLHLLETDIIKGAYQYFQGCRQEEHELKEVGTFMREENLREILQPAVKSRVGSGLWMTPAANITSPKNALECDAGTPERELTCNAQNVREAGWAKINQ